ncbi:hypothetical protein AMECASPLE_005010 [Ameca splendens]|uniref:Uncharacterized protein n=1 Tax=Ameca splendens TaxID=208324 RepID=A0ABV0XN17_9TELE
MGEMGKGRVKSVVLLAAASERHSVQERVYAGNYKLDQEKYVFSKLNSPGNPKNTRVLIEYSNTPVTNISTDDMKLTFTTQLQPTRQLPLIKTVKLSRQDLY